MNFLAHLYLSGSNEEIKVGNFIGDFVKGKNLTDRYGAGFAKGVELHREIDFFTDHHPIVKKSKGRLQPKYKHYAAVIVDIFYDHFLAQKWENYSNDFLPDFADNAYGLIQKHERILPEQVKVMLPHMMKGNWLVNYAQLEGIHRALSGLARRTTYESKMELASEDLKLGYSEYEREFNDFFPELKSFCGDWIKKNQ